MQAEEKLVFQSSCALLGLTVIILLVMILNTASILAGGDDDDQKQKVSKSGSNKSSSKKAQNQMEKNQFKGLAIVGASGSGKTTLFYKLSTGQFRDTVSSIEENYSGAAGFELTGLKLPDGTEIKKVVECVDVPGHFNFRERIQEVANGQVNAFILVVDSKDRTKLAESSELLYDVINNLNILDRKVPILVACNKQDLQFSRKALIVQNEFEREIEEIRKVRRATQDDQDTDQQNVSKSGFLEQLNKPFKFNDAQLHAQLPPISFVEVSLRREELGEIAKFINKHF